jgi:V/A-type H+-transporting ATPase subunit C
MIWSDESMPLMGIANLVIIAGVAVLLLLLIPLVRVGRDIIPYVYSTARIRAKESKLIQGDRLEDLISATSLTEVVSYLEATDYARYMQDLMLTGSEAVERALLNQMADSYVEIASMVPRKVQSTFSVLSRIWDVRNLKTILRGIQERVPSDDIKAHLLHVGELDPKMLYDMAEANTIADVVSALEETRYASISEVLPKYEASRNMLHLETALDRILWEDAWLTVEPTNLVPLKRYLAICVDTINLKTLLRAKNEDVPFDSIQSSLISGGLILKKAEKAFEEADVASMVLALEGTEYYSTMSGAVAEYERTGTLIAIENALDQYLIITGRDISIKQPFGIGPLVGFIAQKEAELKNVRAIARGKEVGLSVDEIRNIVINI